MPLDEKSQPICRGRFQRLPLARKIRILNIEHRISNYEVIYFSLPSTFIIRYSIFDIFMCRGAHRGHRGLIPHRTEPGNAFLDRGVGAEQVHQTSTRQRIDDKHVGRGRVSVFQGNALRSDL